MEGDHAEDQARDLNELQNADWVRIGENHSHNPFHKPEKWQNSEGLAITGYCTESHLQRRSTLSAPPHPASPHPASLWTPLLQARFWVQVMRDLRNGVKLKKVRERQYNPLPIEFQLTPYEMLMDDIRSKRYNLRKVMVSKGGEDYVLYFKG